MVTQEASRHFEHPYPLVWNAFGQALELADYALKQAQPRKGIVSGQPPFKRFFPGLSFRGRLAQQGQGTLVVLSLTQWGMRKDMVKQQFSEFFQLMAEVLKGRTIEVDFMERARTHQRWGTLYLGLSLVLVLVLTMDLLNFLEAPRLVDLGKYLFLFLVLCASALLGILRMDLASHNVVVHLRQQVAQPPSTGKGPEKRTKGSGQNRRYGMSGGSERTTGSVRTDAPVQAKRYDGTGQTEGLEGS